MKCFAYIFVIVLCVDLCVTSMGGLIHKVEHFLLHTDEGVHYQNTKSLDIDSGTAYSPFAFHEHGGSYHSHGSIVTFLLDSIDLSKRDAQSRDTRSLVILCWVLQGIAQDYSPQAIVAVEGAPLAFTRTHELPSALFPEIPTPPPKV